MFDNFQCVDQLDKLKFVEWRQNNMKRYFAIILVSAFLVFTLVGCAAKYHADDFIGKTSAEIISEYGAFDCIGMPASDDGLYRNCKCGYTIKEVQKGFLGTSPEIIYFISFDEKGIATECSKGYRPGG